MIKLTHVSKSFDGGQTYAVKDLSFQVRKGETLILRKLWTTSPKCTMSALIYSG